MKVVDMHCDTIAELFARREKGASCVLRENDCQIDLMRMEQGDYCLQNFALFTNLKEREEPFEYCMKLVDLFYEEMEANRDKIGVVQSFGDIERNRELGRMSALLTIEEGGVCRGELAFLRNFYRLGVRMMTLTWNHENELAYPNRRSVKEGKTYEVSPLTFVQRTLEPDVEHGLKEKGIEFVREMERLGMIIDVSHLSDGGIMDVFRYTTKPLVASHSNARAVASHPRNLTDEMLRLLAERGGVAGINYYSSFLHDWEEGEKEISLVEHMVAHISHMKQAGGIGCIGLGSDFDGIGCDLEMKSPAQLPMLERAMAKAGFTSAEIEAVFYKNVLRVYEEILK